MSSTPYARQKLVSKLDSEPLSAIDLRNESKLSHHRDYLPQLSVNTKFKVQNDFGISPLTKNWNSEIKGQLVKNNKRILRYGIKKNDSQEIQELTLSANQNENKVQTSVQRFLKKVIYKKAPIDTKISIPILANFYSFLAQISQKETILLNMPETILLDLDIVPEQNGFGYLLNDSQDPVLSKIQIQNPEILNMVTPLRLKPHNKIKEAKPYITQWFIKNMKKVKQNQGRSTTNRDQAIFIPLSVTKQCRRKHNIMYLISAVKQYDGNENHGQAKPPKLGQNKQKSSEDNQSPIALQKKEPVLNAQYIYDLQVKLEQQQEFSQKSQNQGRQNKLQKLKFTYIQEEIDNINHFQYQYCTSDKHAERNYIQEINRPNVQFPEIAFQTEILLKIMNGFIKKNKFARQLNKVCFDFIHDFVDRKWKFLTLKHFESEDMQIKNEFDLSPGDPIKQNSLIKQSRSFGISKDIKMKVKRNKCNGDYCNVDDIGGYLQMPFGYLRDSLKILEIQRDKSKEIKIQNDERFMERRKKRSKSEAGSNENQNQQNKFQPSTPVLNNYDIYDDQKFYYRIMKRVIYVDRMRRKEILAGNIPDYEYFQHLDMDKKENNQNIFNDLLKQLYSSDIFQKVNQKNAIMNLNFYENAFLCCKCYRIYHFLSDCYTMQEENFHFEQLRQKEYQSKAGTGYFQGMNKELNGQIINLVQDKMDSKLNNEQQQQKALQRLRLLTLSINKNQSTTKVSSKDTSKVINSKDESQSPKTARFSRTQTQRANTLNRSTLMNLQQLKIDPTQPQKQQEEVNMQSSPNIYTIIDSKQYKNKFINHQRFKTTVSQPSLLQSLRIFNNPYSRAQNNSDLEVIHTQTYTDQPSDCNTVQLPKVSSSVENIKKIKIKKKKKGQNYRINKKRVVYIKGLKQIYLAKEYNEEFSSQQNIKTNASAKKEMLISEHKSVPMTNMTLYSEDFERYSDLDLDDAKAFKSKEQKTQFSNYDALALVQIPPKPNKTPSHQSSLNKSGSDSSNPLSFSNLANFKKQGSLQMLTQNQKIFDSIPEQVSIENEGTKAVLSQCSSRNF
ncbi:UNKNOWN [Stylonychia lemnae]|uniref:Uncharacterized protein n=1 Tax=Stylonychia lemnae TaxID=5949 RepID=A0A077ZR45_STYLE|nr:UNKNOWN [Stylonychia lemnae]|eukprot:CDW71810.1 UNKNOWN [Stylonychia lemnae]